MRDGVLLHTMVNFPEPKFGRVNLTSVIDRSPYGQDALELIADIYVPEGLVGLRQDMRGTGKSEGYFTIWHSDADDTYDTLEWIVAQKWSDSIVFQCGASADGLAAFTTAEDEPPWMYAQFIIWAAADGYTVIYPDGAFLYNLVTQWLKGTIPTNYTALINEVEANEDPASSWWDAVDLTGKYWKVKWPAVMWAGWYDIFLQGNLQGFEGFQYESDPSVAGSMQLVIDPLGHCQDAAKYFPDDLLLGRVTLPVLLSLNLFLDGGKDVENVSAITFYVMGADAHVYPDAPGNYWTTLPAWPVWTPTTWYFTPTGKLVSTPPTTGAVSQTYLYDPANPVPSIGGNNLFISCGPLDQRPVEQGNRSDVLTFTSSPLAAPMTLLGSIYATIFVSSDQVDTDFTVKLTDVYPFPNDNSRLIQDGNLRMRWRDGSPARNMTPGQIYAVNVTLWNTCYVFDQGHSIRVSISSSNYPRYSTSPNNGWPLNTTAGAQGPIHKATNTFYHSSKYPSSITLPVIQLSELPEVFIYDSWVPQIEARLGKEKTAALLAKPSVIDSYYNKEWQQMRQASLPDWYFEYDGYVTV